MPHHDPGSDEREGLAVRDERPWQSQAPPAVWYRFTVDRKGEHPAQHLTTYKGWMHADGYSGFNELYRSGNVREVACMAMSSSPIAEEAIKRSPSPRTRPSSGSRRWLERSATSSAATRPRPTRMLPIVLPCSRVWSGNCRRATRRWSATPPIAAYRRLLRASGKTTDKVFQIDPGKVADEARFDGIFVLHTNATLSPLQAVLRYRDLLKVETLFRNAKALLRTRPIYHQSDAAIRGHVFCSFLALVLQKELADRCSVRDFKPEWGDVLRDLDRLEDITVADQSGELVLRTDAVGYVPSLFQSVGVALPPRLRNSKPPPKTEPPTKRRRGRPRRGATRPRIS